MGTYYTKNVKYCKTCQKRYHADEMDRAIIKGLTDGLHCPVCHLHLRLKSRRSNEAKERQALKQRLYRQEFKPIEVKKQG